MSDIILYDYQDVAVITLRKMMNKGKKNLVLCAPTGSGKTVMFSFMVGGAVSRGLRVLILTDRKELNGQTQQTLEKFGVDSYPIIAKKRKTDFTYNVFNAMTETLSRRMKADPEFINKLNVDIVIVDECHKSIHYKVIKQFKDLKKWIIGVTATPVCSDKKQPLNGFYDSIVIASEVQELINIGKLLPSKHFQADVKIDFAQLKRNYKGEYTEDSMNKQYMDEGAYDSVLKAYATNCEGMKTIVFNCSVKHSKEMTERFIEAGYKSAHLDGETPSKERKEILWKLETGQIQILNSVGTITTGFDCTSVECVILNRAVGVESLYVQMVGRGARIYTYPDGHIMERFFIIDFGLNWERFGDFEKHRFWDEKFHDAKFTHVDGDAPSKMCPECTLIVPASCKACECGYKFPEKKDQEIEITEVKEIEKKVFPQHLLGRTYQSMTVKELEEITEAMELAKNWTLGIIRPDKKKLIELCKLRKYKHNYIYGFLKREKAKNRVWK